MARLLTTIALAMLAAITLGAIAAWSYYTFGVILMMVCTRLVI